ncbi:MAG: XTP/dITP diphosphatase [Actinomycetota bacterium]
MTEIIIASTNDGKIREIKAALAAKGIRWLTYKDFKNWPEVSETENTFEGNARKKALALASYFGKHALADDSGLEVDILGGRPGVTSARFAGQEANTGKNNRKLLKLMAGVPYEERTARFRCVIALASPDGLLETTEGVVAGHIVLKPSGDRGFGYDPLFIPDGRDKTLAELPLEDKNSVSHRGRALGKIKSVVDRLT